MSLTKSSLSLVLSTWVVVGVDHDAVFLTSGNSSVVGALRVIFANAINSRRHLPAHTRLDCTILTPVLKKAIYVAVQSERSVTRIYVATCTRDSLS